jgi:hypothetical protein
MNSYHGQDRRLGDADRRKSTFGLRVFYKFGGPNARRVAWGRRMPADYHRAMDANFPAFTEEPKGANQ